MSGHPEGGAHRDYWRAALMLTCMYWLVHVLGFREHTSIWAGTHVGSSWTIVAGAVYLSLYMLWICAVPICILTGALLCGARALERRRHPEGS